MTRNTAAILALSVFTGMGVLLVRALLAKGVVRAVRLTALLYLGVLGLGIASIAMALAGCSSTKFEPCLTEAVPEREQLGLYRDPETVEVSPDGGAAVILLVEPTSLRRHFTYMTTLEGLVKVAVSCRAP